MTCIVNDEKLSGLKHWNFTRINTYMGPEVKGSRDTKSIWKYEDEGWIKSLVK